MKTQIKIILVEDNRAYRKGISYALESNPDMELIGEFGAVEFALDALEKIATPDILLLDLNLPGLSGLESIPLFREQSPETRIIILTQSDREADVLHTIRLGASGYLLKSTSIAQLIAGIQGVHEGGATLDPAVSQYILNIVQQKPVKEESDTDLSARELEVLKLVAEGQAQKMIASHLNISVHTVSEYIHNIYSKLEVPNAPAAVSKAYESGILPTDQ
jgi:two-component system, NarL family, nitrate/nitrite response regulator NarL